MFSHLQYKLNTRCRYRLKRKKCPSDHLHVFTSSMQLSHCFKEQSSHHEYVFRSITDNGWSAASPVLASPQSSNPLAWIEVMAVVPMVLPLSSSARANVWRGMLSASIPLQPLPSSTPRPHREPQLVSLKTKRRQYTALSQRYSFVSLALETSGVRTAWLFK